MLKKVCYAWVPVMFFALTAYSNSLAENVSKEDRAKVQSAIILINHINWVVNQVEATNDVRMLELEHEGISLDKLNLTSIKDEKIIRQITSIDRFITQRMISIGERKMLARELQFNMDNAIYKAFPSPAAIVAADPLAIAINLVQSTVRSYTSYRDAIANLKIKNERDNWNLEVEDLRALNRLNEVLLKSQWELVTTYNLDDYWRVSQEQVRVLLERINSKSAELHPDELFAFLNHEIQRNTYQKLPAFWYYLGHYAETQNKDDIALEAYDRYQNEFCQVLRFDRMAASVAMNKTMLLLKKKAPAEDIYNQLKIIEKNAHEDWTFLYFCASVYLDNLNDKANADRVLDYAINLLQFQFSETLLNCKTLCKKGELAIDDHTFPNAMPLIACHVLKLRIAGQDKTPAQLKAIFEKFQKDSAKNCFGILSFYGRIPFDEISAYIRSELRSVFIDYQYDNSFKSTAPYRFVLRMPLSWFFADKFDIKMKVTFADGTNPVEVGLHPRYKEKNPVVEEEELVRYVFDCPSNIVRGASPDTIELTLAHKFYPVTIIFDASVLKDAVMRDETSIRMYSKKALFKRKTIRAR